MINREYGTLDENNRITYASSQIRIGNIYIPNPKKEQYAMVGILKIDSTVPQKEGFYYTPTEFGDEIEIESGIREIRRRFNEHEIIPPDPEVIRYSKLKIIGATKEIGKWDALKQFIQDKGLMDEWLVCQYLSSDNEQFSVAKKAIMDAKILSENEIESVLSKSIDNGGIA